MSSLYKEWLRVHGASKRRMATLPPNQGEPEDVWDEIAAARKRRPLLEEISLRSGAGLKYDDAKPRTDLISSIAMLEIGQVLAYGAVKYGPNNWRKGIAWGRLIGAVLRHVFAWMRGEDRDPESGLPHLSHALTTLMMLVEFQQTRRDLDDRWPKEEKA